MQRLEGRAEQFLPDSAQPSTALSYETAYRLRAKSSSRESRGENQQSRLLNRVTDTGVAVVRTKQQANKTSKGGQANIALTTSVGASLSTTTRDRQKRVFKEKENAPKGLPPTSLRYP